jgi:hypothetical protein
MGQIKLQGPLFDKIFLTKLLFIARLYPFEIKLDNLMNFDISTILIYDLFDALIRISFSKLTDM